MVPQKFRQGLLGRAFKRAFRMFPPIGLLFSWVSPYSWFRIRLESDAGPSRTLKTFDSFAVVRAHWTGEVLSNLSSERLDRLAFRTFRRVGVSPNRRGGFIMRGRDIFVPMTGLAAPARLYFQNTSVGGIVEQVERHVLVRRQRKPPEIPAGIFVGSMAPHNWFHWLIDNLSSLYFARYLPAQFDSYPLLISSPALSKPSWLSALDLVSGGRRVLALEPETHVLVNDLVRLDPVTRPNPRPLRLETSARISVLEAPILEFREFIVAELGLSATRPQSGSRIFIGRRATESRRYNQQEIFRAAEGYGFRMVYLDDFEFAESVKLFREAEVIVGPHGAGWANLLFCSPETKALLWTWGGGDPDNWYENIAYVSRVRYQQIYIDRERFAGEDPRVADFFLNEAVFRQGLETLLGA